MVTSLRAVVAGVCGALVVAVARGQAAPPYFVEFAAKTTPWYVQQVAPVTLRIGFDAQFVRDSAVPLFAQRLDQPFQVVVPWLAGDEALHVAVLAPAGDVRTHRIAVGEQVLPLALATSQQRAGRTYEVLELQFVLQPQQPGPMALAAVALRHAFATRFVEDFLRGRQPADRQEATLVATMPAIEVLPLPPDAPAGFGGAVGAFAVTATLASKPRAVGDSFLVELVVTGDGNLATMPAPSPPSLAGFHVQGVSSGRTQGRAVFALDVLALRAGEVALPPLPFVAFDPHRSTYVTLATQPLPLTIAPATAALPERVQRLVAADGRTVAAAAPRAWWPWAVAVVGGLGLALLPFLVRARRRQQRFVQARQALEQAFAAGPNATLAAFEAVLAAASGVDAFSDTTWSALHARLGGDAIAPLRELHTAFDQARFGAVPPTPAACEATLAKVLRR